MQKSQIIIGDILWRLAVSLVYFHKFGGIDKVQMGDGGTRSQEFNEGVFILVDQRGGE